MATQMLSERLDAGDTHLDLRLWIWSGAQRNRRIPHDPAQRERQRDRDSFPVGHGAPLSAGGKARGAPGSFSLGAPRFVFLGTLRRGGRRVLLTTVLLIEEPEGQHDQADDQPDFEDEKEDRQKQHGSELPETDAQDSDRGERKHGLHHKIRLKGTSPIRGRSREVSPVSNIGSELSEELRGLGAGGWWRSHPRQRPTRVR